MDAICLLTDSMFDLHDRRTECKFFHSACENVLCATLPTRTFWFTWSILAFTTLDLMASITKLSISSLLSCSLSDNVAKESSLFSSAKQQLCLIIHINDTLSHKKN